MKVCVLGDLHGKKFKLPEAELYLGVGDLSSLGDTPEKKREGFNSAIKSDLEIMKGFFRSQDEREFLKFVSETYREMYGWLNSLEKPVYMVSGNREIILTLIMKEFQPGVETPYETVESFGNIRYIDNQTVRFNGLKIYGLPFVPSNEPYVHRFSRIPLFRERFESLRNVKISGKPDIILSHSPPLGILDHSSVVGYAGSIEVLRVLKEKQPRYLFCGHLHEAKGMKQVGQTTVVNLGMTYELFDL